MLGHALRISLLSVLLLTGCAGELIVGEAYPAPPARARVEIIPVAPPLRVEVIPERPSYYHAWVPGRWEWRHERHEHMWVPGYWHHRG